MYEPTQLT